MPQLASSAKRKYKVLNYTTEEFITKLLNRGYTINNPLREQLNQVMLDAYQKQIDCHSIGFWQKWHLEQATTSNIHPDKTNASMSTLPAKTTLSTGELCECLFPLHSHNINYANLVVVFHTFSVQQWKNFYRFCYLEWAKHNATEPLWIHTPRDFASFNDDDVFTNSLLFLKHMIQVPQTDTRIIRSLFVVNRLYKYLLPIL